MRPTRISTLLTILVCTTAVSWGVLRIAESLGAVLPSLTWAAPAGVLGLAFVVAASAVALRRRLRGGPERKPVQPLGAARMAVLGKASAHVGPLLGGCYAGYALLLLPALDVEVRRDRATVAVVAFVASLLLTAAGLWLERICRVSGGDDQDAPPPVPSV